MTPITKDNSILNSYKRIGGGTPVINTSNQTGRISGATPTIKVSKDIGPQFKSKTESALERYAAEKAVEEQRQKDAEAKNPALKIMREQSEMAQKSASDYWEKQKQNAANMRNRWARETGGRGGEEGYRSWFDNLLKQQSKAEIEKDRNWIAATRGLEGIRPTTSQYGAQIGNASF